MNKSHLVKQWKKTYGEDFKRQYGGVFRKLPFHFTKETLVRLWDKTYGEDFKHEYPQVFKLLGVNEGVESWKIGDKIKYKATKTGKWRKGKIRKKLSSGRYELDSGKIVYEKDPDAIKENKLKLTKSKLKEIVKEVMHEAQFRQGDKFELGKDLDYGDKKLHAGDYEVVRSKGPHQYQLKDTHSGKQYTLRKKDFEKYTKKKQFKQISEGNPTPAIQKKLIKIFQNDPLYKDVIMATNSKQMQKALGTLRSIRGPNAIKLLKKHSKKLMGKDY